ncbi:MAG: glycoside hydrolase family 127 protein [Bacteroidales bacterium]|nr:glycoside hydrolase family 127 protein [Bacteroidales bacterium]
MKKAIVITMSLISFFTYGQNTKENPAFPGEAFKVNRPVEQKYQWLRFGEIKPAGWIREQMESDLDGFVGHLDELVPDLMNDKIYGTDRLTKKLKSKNLGNTGPELDPQYLWWNSETQSNWRDGYIRHAILLNNSGHLEKAQKYIEYLLSTQDDDGYLGIYSPELRYTFSDENGELWAKTTALRGMLAWYEYTGKPEILDAIKLIVKEVMNHYPAGASSPFRSLKPFAGGLTHGLVFTDILDRLFQLTGKQEYLNYALFLYEDFSGNLLAEDAQLGKILDPAYSNKEHGVHTYEHLRPLTMAWIASGNERLKSALDIYIERIRQCSTPSGGPIGDEWVGGRHASAGETGYEYCSIHELLDGYTNLLQKTGDSRFGDLAEKLFFNAAQGARHPGESAIAYCKTDNSFAMTGTKNGEPAGTEAQTRFKYSPAHQDVAVCCVPNAGRITPYFVKSMWLKDNEGLISSLLGPCEVQTDFNGVKIHVAEVTDYPFVNTISYNVKVEKKVAFVLKIRKPEWTKSVGLNFNYTEKDGYLYISRTWEGTENVQLELFSEPEVHKDLNGENYFSSGALLFALPVESREIVIKSYPFEGFKDLGYEPLNPVKYRFPSTGKPEISIKKNESSTNKWGVTALTTSLVNESTGVSENVNLLPLGATILRQVTFKNEVLTTSGTIERFMNFRSACVDARNVDVWLPEGYSTKKRYAVLYMHDGQMLFDSTSNWNKQEWGVDETIGRLVRENKMKDCIVVGIWNTTKRHAEYFPSKPFESMNTEQKSLVNSELQNLGRTTETFIPVSDQYLKFIVSELKPFIDSAFSTLKDKENTFIAGSSMGGLISMYAICEYPGVFGGAACLSTHWPGVFSMDNNPCPDAFFSYLQGNLPDPATHLIYFDYGDQTLDALYPPLQNKADDVMRKKGYSPENWMTRFFPGEDHSERAWKRRFEIPVMFLLGL